MENLIVKPLVVLIGKTNVGKSTLFNRLACKRFNIAHSTPGATRDCITKDTSFFGHSLTIADTGGLASGQTKNPFQDLITKRVHEFVTEKASLVLFVVSEKDGLSEEDELIAKFLRRTGKPILTVVNKVDNEHSHNTAMESFRFGFSDPVHISAAQNLGISALKENVLKALDLKPKSQERDPVILSLVTNQEDSMQVDEDETKIKIAVMGKPNSGKSTLVNALLNEDRLMVSERPGTTVDAVDTDLFYKGQEICLIDTAGIRRQRSIYEEVEKMAVARSLCALDRADVAILLISAEDGISEQDQKIAGMILDKKKACVIAVNKWDREIKNAALKGQLLADIKFHLSFLSFAPVEFLSAKQGTHIFDVVDRALILAPRFRRHINTSKLNRSLERAIAMHPPPVFLGRRLKMFFVTQIDSSPPTFAIRCSKPQGIHFSYKRYLANFFREDLDLNEIPIRLIFRDKDNTEPVSRDG